MSDLCNPIVQRLAQFGRDGNVNENVPLYNALNQLALECQASQRGVGTGNLALIANLSRNLLTSEARRQETAAVQTQPPGDRVDYSYDISPLEQHMIALEDQLRACERSVTGMSGGDVGPACIGFCIDRPDCRACCEKSCFAEEVQGCKNQCGGYR